MPKSQRPNPLARSRGAAALGAGAFDLLTARIHEFHRAISDMPFNGMAPAPLVKQGSEPVRLIHDGITDGVYETIRQIGGALFKTANAAIKAAERNYLPPVPGALSLTPPNVAVDNVVSAISGFVGDHMAHERNPLTVKLGFYRDGHKRALTPSSLAATYPLSTGKLAVFLHGLCCNEHSWTLYHEPHNPETLPYGTRLHADLGYTPLYLRYNSGLHVSLNGRTLARQLEKLVDNWPVPVTELVLIGHSMGGLLARSACHAGLKANMRWTTKVSNVICLGTPHLGAPLEQVVHLGTSVMDAFALSRPLSKLLNIRSPGIRDLRHGFVADEDWKGRPADALNADARTPIPHLKNARYHFIGSSIGASENDLVGKVIGDGLVKLDSATAAHIADADTAVLFRAHHMRLLNHPVIYQQLRERLKAPAKRLRAP